MSDWSILQSLGDDRIVTETVNLTNWHEARANLPVPIERRKGAHGLKTPLCSYQVSEVLELRSEVSDGPVKRLFLQ